MAVKRVITKQELLIRRVRMLIQLERFSELKKLLKETRPEDIANSLLRFDDEEKLHIFVLLPVAAAGTVLNETDLNSEKYLLENIDDERLASILTHLPDDEAVDILSQLDDERSDKLLNLVKESAGIEKLMSYPPESAGGIMSTQFIAVTGSATVKSALGSIRSFKADDPELYHIIYVVDDGNHLLGFLTLSALLKASPAKKISSIFQRDPIRVQPGIDQEEVARLVSLYNLINIPVVDESNELLGVIYVEDVIDVINDEAAEDFYKMAGIHEEDISDPSIVRNTRNRLPWLIATLFGSLLSSLIIEYFQPTLDKVVALAAFMPLIAAMSGNVGVQSSSIIIRGLATGHIALHSLGKVIFRELRVGLMLGAITGLCVGLVVHYWKIDIMVLDIGFALGVAMLCAITVAAIMGSFIPFVLEKIGVDPAVATGPFVTTINDITGLSIYFLTANLLMQEDAGYFLFGGWINKLLSG